MTKSDILDKKGEIRCFCSRSPLLGVYGVGRDGRAFISVKVWKQNRLYAEMIFKDGEISMKCRDCYRWYRIFITNKQPYTLMEIETPEIENSNQTNDSQE